MRCIEIIPTPYLDFLHMLINRNMRCIEIYLRKLKAISTVRLIETWDVLKLEYHDRMLKDIDGLIETWDVLKWILMF